MTRRPLIIGVMCAAIGATGSGAPAAADADAIRTPGDAAPSGTVIVGLGLEPRTLNVLTIEGNLASAHYVLQPVVGLASKYDHRGALIHDLLEGVTVSNESPLVVTYRIKLAAKWSDNRPVSADDMIFTYRQIMNPSHSIASRVGFEDIGRIQKVNAKTIRVTFKKVYASYKSLWGSIYPAHAGGGIAGQAFDQAWRNGPPIANGPFRFAKWDRGSQIVLQRNRNFWGKQAQLGQIVFRFLPDTNTQFQAMRGGEVDIIAPDLQQQIAGIRKQPGITTQTGSQFTWEHVDFQLGAGGHPALKKRYVRAAIVTAINRLQMRQVLFGEVAPNLPALDNVIYKHFQPEYVAHKYQPYGFSQRKAIELLRSNGCTGGPRTPKAGNHDIYSCPEVGKLEFDFYSTAGNQQRELAVQIMQAQLRSVGIQVNAQLSRTALTLTLPRRTWDIMLYSWIGSPDPGGSVNIHRCGGTQNHQSYCSRPASRLLLKSNETLDAKKRSELLNEADRLIASHIVTLPLYSRPGFVIHKSRLKGVLINPTNTGLTWNTESWSFAE